MIIIVEQTSCLVHHVVQSESQNHVTLTMIYMLAPSSEMD